MEFQVSNQVFLKISSMKGVVKAHSIMNRIGVVAYNLELPLELESIHPIFHVFMLKKYGSHPSLILPQIPIELDNYLSYKG